MALGQEPSSALAAARENTELENAIADIQTIAHDCLRHLSDIHRRVVPPMPSDQSATPAPVARTYLEKLQDVTGTLRAATKLVADMNGKI